MENIAFKISEFAAVMHGHCLDDDITIIKIDSSNNGQLNNIIEEHFLTRLRGDISCSFFINSGEATATIDYKTYAASSSSILAMAPHKILTQLYLSSDFSGILDIKTVSAKNRKTTPYDTQFLAANSATI